MASASSMAVKAEIAISPSRKGSVMVLVTIQAEPFYGVDAYATSAGTTATGMASYPVLPPQQTVTAVCVSTNMAT